MRAVLITAGATRNPVDAIRYLSASASGRTGIELAHRLRSGFNVHVLGSEEACLRAPELRPETFGSTRDLMARMERWCRAHPDGVVIHSAAVGDYEAQTSDTKIPSGQAELVLRLTPGPKILDHIRGWAPGSFLISFKAARPGIGPDELYAIAHAQLQRTDCDLVFANALGALQTSVMLVDRHGRHPFSTRAAAVDALVERIHQASLQ